MHAGKVIRMKQKTSAAAVLGRLRSMADPAAVAGMARFGIHTRAALGISVPTLRKIASEIGPDHALARELWESGIHEARILAALIEDSAMVTEAQMEVWVEGFDSWDVCDGCCANLFDKTPFAYRKAIEWSGRKEEFVKRAGFTLMAQLAVHDKRAKDPKFARFFVAIRRESMDERNFVKKAVNWALRQIGKRNLSLNHAAIRTAQEIERIGSRSARWIAADALRELTSEAVQKGCAGKSAGQSRPQDGPSDRCIEVIPTSRFGQEIRLCVPRHPWRRHGGSQICCWDFRRRALRLHKFSR
jgi:3-methyladenine DNA glycosylase AlkD